MQAGRLSSGGKFRYRGTEANATLTAQRTGVFNLDDTRGYAWELVCIANMCTTGKSEPGSQGFGLETRVGRAVSLGIPQVGRKPAWGTKAWPGIPRLELGTPPWKKLAVPWLPKGHHPWLGNPGYNLSN